MDGENLLIVTILGPKGIGKSFLLDSLITDDDSKVSRVMSSKTHPIVNTTTYEYKGKNDANVQFFDVNLRL